MNILLVFVMLSGLMLAICGLAMQSFALVLLAAIVYLIGWLGQGRRWWRRKQQGPVTTPQKPQRPETTSKLARLAANLRLRAGVRRQSKPGEVVFRHALNEQAQTGPALQRIQLEVVLKGNGSTGQAAGIVGSPGGAGLLDGNGSSANLLGNAGGAGIFEGNGPLDGRARNLLEP